MSRATRTGRTKAPTPPIEVRAGRHRPLGMAPARFLRDYWQKRPVLIRGAFPGFVTPIEPEDLAGLACEELALSRLIQHDRARDAWRVRTGPFPEELFPTLGDRDWTLLVQDVDKWDADVAALLPHFDFIPRWRIDDIMVSFAATGGSVGAHTDQYDVFLLQAQGRRRWLIDAGPDPRLDFRDDVDIKLLREFTPSHDWVLEPGDMLYLPPGVPHHGIAEDPCLTFSVGMRAPSLYTHFDSKNAIYEGTTTFATAGDITINGSTQKHSWDPASAAGISDMAVDLRINNITPNSAGQIEIRVEATGPNDAILQAIEIE